MHGMARWLAALFCCAVLAGAACDGDGGGGGAADTGYSYGFADLAGTWNYYYVNKGGFGGTITWDASGQLTKWLNPDCGSGVVSVAMTFTVSPEGKVSGEGKAWCSNSNPATADPFFMTLYFRSATFMKGSMGDAGDMVTVAFYKK